MNIKSLLVYFFTGGIVTALIVALEESGLRSWSGLAALVPIFTVVSYVFIGDSKGGTAVGQHSKFVLAGTLVSWVPYMLTVAFLAPRLGANRAIALGLGIFFILAGLYIVVANRFGLFE